MIKLRAVSNEMDTLKKSETKTATIKGVKIEQFLKYTLFLKYYILPFFFVIIDD